MAQLSGAEAAARRLQAQLSDADALARDREHSLELLLTDKAYLVGCPRAACLAAWHGCSVVS